MVQPKIDISREQLTAFCRKHHLRKLSLFGSVLRDDFRPDSDVDVLIEFAPGHRVGFIGLHAVEEELSSLFGGHKIDLVSPKYLNRRLRERVLSEAEVQYVER